MTYPQLPGLTPDGRIYENVDMGTLESFLPTGGYPTAHAPAMLEMPDGALLCCWFAGTYEGSADIRIICSRLEKDGLKWSDPVDISGDPERSEQNPSLFAGNDGAVWAIYTAQKDRQAGKDNMQFTSQIRVQKSVDGGRTRGPYETLFAREGSFCRQPIQVLSNGRWIFANWLCTDSPDGLSGDPTALQISDDEGKTWRQVDMPGSRGRVHANVVEIGPGGRLAAFMRSREADNIYRSESLDWGDMAVHKPVTMDYIALVCVVVLLLEAVRRTLGYILFFFIIAFIVYSWVSPFLPAGVFRTVATAKNKTFPKMLEKFTEGMVMAEQGVYGTPLQTSCTSLFYFILFGAFFSECGGGQLLIDVGMKFSNKSSGGPAKAAVISSGLMGMVSGSAVANVATTGVMTIPMMKKIGYAPEEAGAIEAVASTGGQIMPPIMGIGAFIMAEQLGINYLTVAADAIIPAVAYYFGVFVLVDRLAKKRASRSAASEDIKIKVDRKILPRLYLLLPIVVLIISILNGFSLMRSGMFGIFACLLCNLVSLVLGLKKGGNFKHDIIEGNKDADFAGLKQLWKSCVDGAKSAAEIAVPTAACGIIINVMTAQTSLATNLSGVIANLGMTSLFLAMMIAMVGCMLLGMALPTVAAYLVGVTLFVPTMQKLGISPLVANMFVFYYGIMAQITPPVCVASYTAAGIADADAMKTGIRGMLFALVGFLVPFVFVYNPAILLQGPVLEIGWGGAQVLAATFFLAITVAGFFKRDMHWWERAVTFAAAILLMTPEIITSVIGIVLGVGVLLMDMLLGKSKKAAA